MNCLNACKDVLRSSTKPLTPKEIYSEIKKRGIWQTNGKTPWQTISAQIYTDLKKNGGSSEFIKASPLEFGIRGIHSPSVPKIDAISFLDSAERILHANNGKPMHYKKITQNALKLKLIKTEGKTPEATMNAQLVTDIKKVRADGKPSRFVKYGKGMYGLTSWEKSDSLINQIVKHNLEIRKKLRNRLMEMKPDKFEEVIGMLLPEMGFESVEVTSLHNDGGIDVRGVFQLAGSLRINMAVQVKRWKHNVQRNVVQAFRGSLTTHEQGIIITTSDFSKGAKEESEHTGKTPIALINGEDLLGLLIKYNIFIKKLHLI